MDQKLILVILMICHEITSGAVKDKAVKEGNLSFNQTRDSGVYSCASLKGSELIFGNPTRLFQEKVKVPIEETSQATEQTKCTTASPCVCESGNKPGETSPEMFCSLIILGPLAGGCGLLLLLLIITIVYCNHVRTRRCPHHYKRKQAPGKQMMTNSHV
ncbi:T-cell surface glycoprotein CD8 alpha chain [Dissostichus eleginoides]|uniref:T-cell surface glycoprotein CD8 alpha chain n=1 Tax=Dissostichus eleginoides TaxID=100907 RepID=A0AAD9CFL1_DISEL|nr:T-cell surface glycoprotein CD8 alpha chain [Dissostichus eleginoides]